MSYMVTGGTGFIGSYISRELVRRGEKVIAHELLPNTTVMESIMSPEEMGEIVVTQGDISDFVQLARVIKEHAIERIIHLASTVHPQSDLNPPLAEKVINLGMVNVLECARLFDLKKIVWASTVGVFGPSEKGLILNEDPHNPPMVYGACKSHCEFLAKHYRKSWGVDHIGLRPTIVYGPGRERGISSFVQKLMAEPAVGTPTVVPFGDAVIDWQYVEDIASLFVKCSTIGPTKTQVYNVKGDVRSVREAKEYVLSLLPDADITLEPGDLFAGDFRVDDSELQAEIGFSPEYTMEKGILATINFFRTAAGLPQLA